MNKNEGSFSSFQTNDTRNKVANSEYINSSKNNNSNTNNFIIQKKKTNKKKVTFNNEIETIHVESYKRLNKLYCYNEDEEFEKYNNEHNEYDKIYNDFQTYPVFNKNLRDSLRKEENKSKCCCIIF